jgi:2-oxoglutarate ferredoxin oxidoreductase subunit delta
MVKAKAKPYIKILEDLCKGCKLCVEACPKDCIEMGAHVNAKGVNPAVFARPDECTGCRNCSVICPDIAIEVYKDDAE